jgi:hypothetical protein
VHVGKRVCVCTHVCMYSAICIQESELDYNMLFYSVDGRLLGNYQVGCVCVYSAMQPLGPLDFNVGSVLKSQGVARIMPDVCA